MYKDLEKRAAYRREWAKKHRESERLRLRQWQDANREHVNEYMREYRKRDPEKLKLQRKIRRINLKQETLSYYSNENIPSCVVCAEARIDCLSIDHINGGGYQHRMGESGIGNNLYEWLKSNNWPTGFQTLCMNCQFIKRMANGENGHYVVQ